MTTYYSAAQQLENLVRSQVNAQLAERYNLGIAANVNYSNKVLYTMERAGLVRIQRPDEKKYLC